MHCNRIIAEARSWLGTPYKHRAAVKGAGCDCLGLVMGVYAALVGPVPEDPPPYSRDWAEAAGEETLLAAARRHLVELPVAEAGPGDVLIFRILTGRICKHAGILSRPGHMIHAMEGHGVVEIALSPWWRRKVAAAFAFPGA
ncbi:MAG: C40 family peptidase [Alphaproteobacteria bacterium]|nr:C40 family peptidase [Alphaproteobacteria bacterium]